MRGAWLTTDTTTAAGFVCRSLLIPNDVELIAAVNGALLELIKPENWEQFGAATPEQTAELMQTMFLDYLNSGCGLDMSDVTVSCETGEECGVTFDPETNELHFILPRGLTGATGETGATGATGPQGPAGIDATAPIGAIIAYGGASAPSGYLECDGTGYTEASYPLLYAAINPIWKNTLAHTFVVPDLRGRAPIGAGTGAGLTARAMGATVGNETHTLTTPEMPSHSHMQRLLTSTSGAVSGEVDAFDATASNVVDTGLQTGLTGGGGAHNNMQPSLAVRFYMRAV